mmetsp:Transcript_13937/g.22430  ORF Transcript_13937/g.22430 Transcript_13937/m.22430 type:complete len:204 (-) Transcript_13937:598-1209(-)
MTHRRGTREGNHTVAEVKLLSRDFNMLSYQRMRQIFVRVGNTMTTVKRLMATGERHGRRRNRAAHVTGLPAVISVIHVHGAMRGTNQPILTGVICITNAFLFRIAPSVIVFYITALRVTSKVASGTPAMHIVIIGVVRGVSHAHASTMVVKMGTADGHIVPHVGFMVQTVLIFHAKSGTATRYVVCAYPMIASPTTHHRRLLG